MKISTQWDEFLSDELQKDYFLALEKVLEQEYRTKTIFPPKNLIYKALREVPPSSVRVVILGQDPYHGDNQANGLAFSVPSDTQLPPTLKNIFREIHESHNCPERFSPSGDLTYLAEQGVLLLNSILTVERSCPSSHSSLGWQTLTDAIIQRLGSLDRPIAFILWGNYAKTKARLISSNHLVLTSPHPSPLSAYRGFFGSNVFVKVNDFLSKNNISPVNWLPN